MSWTARPDSEQCCGADPGPPADGESVVRLIHTRIEEPEYEPFSRNQLVVLNGFSNACGDADGTSVTRMHDLSDADVCAMAERLAAIRPGREGRGGLVAAVGAIRAVRLPHLPDEQICFVYDDPKLDDKFHSVIRVRSDLERTEIDEARVRLRAAFQRRIRPEDITDASANDDNVLFTEGALQCVVPSSRK